MFQLNELKGIKMCAKCATRIGCIAFYLADIRLLQTELFALQTELLSGFHLSNSLLKDQDIIMRNEKPLLCTCICELKFFE